MRPAVRTVVVALLTLIVPAGLPPAAAAAAAAGAEQVAPGVEYRAFTVPTSHGSARVHLLTVDLHHGRARAGLLFPGTVTARQPVSEMALAQGAVAAVNGDFFDISEAQHPGVQATGATSGPAIADGLALKAAVPQAQRFGSTPAPGDSAEDVFGVGTDGQARTGRLSLRGHLATPGADLPLKGLNQYALPVGSVGVFTPRWGEASRARAACGNDDDRAAPCTRDVYEVTVRHGRVEAVSDTPGSGAIPAGSVVLLGREAGTRALRELTPGTPAEVGYRLDADGGVPFAFALGAHPLLRAGRPVPALDAVTAEPRTAVGIAGGGQLLSLLSTDGREGTSSGLTVTELADVLADVGCQEGAYLDGGASATLVTRDHATGAVNVRNNLGGAQERAVPNGIAVYSP